MKRLLLGAAAGTALGLFAVTGLHVHALSRVAPVLDVALKPGKSGPVRVGLQVGHLETQNLPDELAQFRRSTGASGGGISEAEANLAVAQAVKKRLESRAVTVDILPATVPPGYSADIFLSIHADGSPDASMSGYKVAPFVRDFTGDAEDLARILHRTYGATGLRADPNITRNMRGYYAFNAWRFDHAVSFNTPAAIIETGFMSNPSDRSLLTRQTEIPAGAIAAGILEYLESKERLEPVRSAG